MSWLNKMILKYSRIIAVLYACYLLLYAYFLDFKLGGVSFSFLRDFAFLIILIAFIGSLLFLQKKKLSKGYTIVHLLLGGFWACVFVSAFASHDVLLVLPLLLRLFIFTFVLITLSLISFNYSSVYYYYKVIFSTLFIYIIISLLLTITKFGWSSNGGIEGLAGQHFSKFIFVIASSFFTCIIVEKIKLKEKVKKLEILALFMSMVCLILVLQRGAVIAYAVSLFVIFVFWRGRSSVIGISCFTVLAFLAVLTLLNDEKFIAYAFFKEFGPKVILDSIIDGTFNISMIRSRGRLDIIQTLLDNSAFNLFGNGVGYAKSIVGHHFFMGKEPHNDMLMLLVDYGFLGLFFFIGAIVCYLHQGGKLLKVNNGKSYLHTSILFYTGASTFLGFLVWMFVSNVLIYLPYNILFSAIMLGIAIGYRSRGEDEYFK